MAEKEKMAIVVFSGDLDRALAAFGLAITAASMGMEVVMFFTFWGLDILKKNEGGSRGKGLKRKILNLVNRGSSRRLRLSKFNMLGLGTWMFKGLMKEVKMPSVDQFITMAKKMGVKIVACTTIMEVMGLDENSFRSEVDSLVGAAYFLAEARESKISLFI